MSTIPIQLLNDNQLWNVINSLNYLNRFYGNIRGKIDGIRDALSIIYRNRIYTGSIVSVTNNSFYEMIQRIHLAISTYFIERITLIRQLIGQNPFPTAKVIEEMKNIRSLEIVQNLVNNAIGGFDKINERHRNIIRDCVADVTFVNCVCLKIIVNDVEARCYIIKQCKFGVLQIHNKAESVSAELLPFVPLEEPDNFQYSVYQSMKPGNSISPQKSTFTSYNYYQRNVQSPSYTSVYTNPLALHNNQTQLKQQKTQPLQIKPTNQIEQKQVRSDVNSNQSKQIRQESKIDEKDKRKETKIKQSKSKLKETKEVKEKDIAINIKFESKDKEIEYYKQMYEEQKKKNEENEKKIKSLKEANKQWNDAYVDIKKKYDDEQEEIKKLKQQLKQMKKDQDQPMDQSMNQSLNPESIKKIKVKMEQLKNANDQWTKAYQQLEEQCKKEKAEKEEIHQKALNDCSLLQIQIQKRNEEIKKLKDILENIQQLAANAK